MVALGSGWLDRNRWWLRCPTHVMHGMHKQTTATTTTTTRACTYKHTASGQKSESSCWHITWSPYRLTGWPPIRSEIRPSSWCLSTYKQTFVSQISFWFGWNISVSDSKSNSFYSRLVILLLNCYC